MPTPEPHLTFVIPTRDRAERTLHTVLRLRSLVSMPYEVVVVDNASSDGTADRLEKLGFPELKLIRLAKNRIAAARNDGLRRARAPFAVMLDDDSLPRAGAVERAIGVLASCPEVGVVAGRIRLTRRGGSDETAGGPHTFIGCGAVFRTTQLQQLGGYPEDYGYGAEEYEVSARYLAQGLSVRTFSDIEFDHHHEPKARDHGRWLGFLARNNLVYFTRWLEPEYSAHVCAWVARRYALIAERADCRAAVAVGLEDGWLKRQALIADGDVGRAQHTEVQECIAPDRLLCERLAPLVDRHGGPPLLFGLGREAGFFIDALRRLGAPPVALIDEELGGWTSQFMDVPVCRHAPAPSPIPENPGWLLLGTTAPGCGDVWLRRAERLWGGPIEQLATWSRWPRAENLLSRVTRSA